MSFFFSTIKWYKLLNATVAIQAKREQKPNSKTASYCMTEKHIQPHPQGKKFKQLFSISREDSVAQFLLLPFPFPSHIPSQQKQYPKSSQSENKISTLTETNFVSSVTNGERKTSSALGVTLSIKTVIIQQLKGKTIPH